MSCLEKKTILIIGETSTLGLYFKKSSVFENFKIITSTREKSNLNKDNIYIDLDDINSFSSISIKFDYVLICAAITSNKSCEIDLIKSYKINVLNTYFLTKHLISKGSFVINFSTTQVFNGNQSHMSIDEKPNAVTVYGKQKSILEAKLIDLGHLSSIFRVSKVLSGNNKLFEKWISDLKANTTISVFSDMFFSPISIKTLSVYVRYILENKVSGISQLSASYDISYFDAIKYICHKLNLNESLIKPIASIHSENGYSTKHTTLKSTFHNLSEINPFQSLDYFIDKYNKC